MLDCFTCAAGAVWAKVSKTEHEVATMENCKKILFFSRGLGRGHAIPDFAISKELLKLAPDSEITFVSYSTGAATLRDLGCSVIDVELPEDNPLWDTVLRAMAIFSETRPTLVVSHEELSVLPIAKGFGLPTVFLTDWFVNEDWISMQALKHADEVIFLDEPGFFDEPSYLRGGVYYSGLVFRDISSPTGDRGCCRSSLDLPQRSIVILVLPGGAEIHSEAKAPLFDVILDAFTSLEGTDNRLLWVTGSPDYERLRDRSRQRQDVQVMRPHHTLTCTMIASDLVITKGNRTPLLECEALGIPSISLSFGYNIIDDSRIARISTNIALRGRGLSCTTLRGYMIKAIEKGRNFQRKSVDEISTGRKKAAQRIHQHLMTGAGC